MRWVACCANCLFEEDFAVIPGVGIELQMSTLKETARVIHDVLYTDCEDTRIELALDETQATPKNAG